MNRNKYALILELIAALGPLGWGLSYLFTVYGLKTPSGTSATLFFRQFGGIYLLSFILFFLVGKFAIPVLQGILSVLFMAAWLINIINIIRQYRKPIPFIGQYFEKYLNFI